VIGGSAIARRYARALFALGEETSEPKTLLDELNELVESATVMPELARVVFTPLHPRSERRAVVAELARRLDHSDELRAFAMLLVDENRMSLLSEIRDALRDLVEQAAGRLRARVISARKLERRELDGLRRVLSKRTKAVVDLETEIDPDLIGGVVVRVGDLLLDGSLRTQLDSLRGSLRKGSA
jgi:F-type H+-transporting ATPase subunit delta